MKEKKMDSFDIIFKIIRYIHTIHRKERERESEGNMSTYVVTMFGLSWAKKKKMDRRIG